MCESDLFSAGSGASTSASSASDSPSSGSQKSTPSPAPCCESTGPTSRTLETFALSSPAPDADSRSRRSISSVAASHASRSVSRDSGAAKQTSGGSGRKCGESLDLFDPVGSLLRTSLASELEAMTGSRKTWSEQVTPSGHSWWVLTTLERRTDGSESGLLPTPTRSDANASGSRNTAHSKAHSGVSLTDWIRGDGGRGRLLPTPSHRDYRSPNALPYSERGGGEKGEQLPNFVAHQLGMQDRLSPPVCELDDGLPPGLVRHRRPALAALGNAIVPQIAEAIGRAVLRVEAALR